MLNPKRFFIGKVKQEGLTVVREIQKQLSMLVVMAVGWLIAGSWKDFMKALFDAILPNTAANLIAQLIYVIMITIIGVLAVVYITRVFAKLDEFTKEEEEEIEEETGGKGY